MGGGQRDPVVRECRLPFRSQLDADVLRTRTHASFVLLFGGLAAEERAARMVREHLLKPAESWRPMPVPGVPADGAAFELDMWRGPVWFCHNHLNADGLVRSGFEDAARELMERTVTGIVRWHRTTGALWAFYDPAARVEPARIDRKGFRQGGGVRDIGGNAAHSSWTAAGHLRFVDRQRRRR